MIDAAPASGTPSIPMPRAVGSYLYSIDLIRFVCAVSVACFHLTWRAEQQTWGVPFGWVGVEVFFVISGLVIANSAFGSTVHRFAVSRFLRLYPAAWCALVVNGAFLLSAPALAYYHQGIGAGWSARSFLGSFTLVGPGHLGTAYWTLPVEIAFYALVAVLLFLRRFNHVEGWAVALIAWSLPYAVYLWLHPRGWLHPGPLDFGYSIRNASLMRHGCYFGLGMLLWCLHHKRLTRVGAAAMVAAFAIAFVEIADRAGDVRNGLLRPVFFGIPVTPLSLAWMSYAAFLFAVAALFFSVAFNARFMPHPGVRRAVRLMGLTTYPFYLLHESVGGCVLEYAEQYGASPQAALLLALAAIGLLAVFIAAWAEPLLGRLLRDRIPILQTAAGAAPAAKA